ncbi:MAG: Fic family protein [Micavibrio aeruginosavorus]|uniref:Fic family protein n=1 Tax=Micavibrio aeruginosavorus TaxID=349221 RepID=A0A7T5R4N0_9BACT|nr:MAG: Fic family protein [Micavibrio aeruginosavorus]
MKRRAYHPFIDGNKRTALAAGDLSEDELAAR